MPKKPDLIIHAGGKEFQLYKYYDDSFKKDIINYPDFEETPEYTDDGRPFVLMVQEWCQHGKSADPDYPVPGICGDCDWCYLENPADPIGVCMCNARWRGELKLESNKEEQPK